MRYEQLLRVLSDDPAEADLLGFGMIAEALSEIVMDSALESITVGVFSPWGGGKSTILGLVERELRQECDRQSALVIRVNPWQYDDFTDVRERLIGQILDQLPKPDDSAIKKMGRLLARVQWSRVVRTAAIASVTGVLVPTDLINSFEMKQSKELPRVPDMEGFRDEFAQYVKSNTGVERIVVLVDDLDRCLPDATVAVMEALKLFLMVPHMSFVLALDEGLIRTSISESHQAARRGDFADRYLDKIVQVPVRLPVLATQEATAYVALLLLQGNVPDDEFQLVLDQLAERRITGTGSLPAPTTPTTAEAFQLAVQTVEGLSTDNAGSPRAIKRFLNEWAVRSRLARHRGIELNPTISLKLMLLETRYPNDFKVLASQSSEQRRRTLTEWEEWARQDVEDAKSPPAGISSHSRSWAAGAPSLADEDGIDRYLTLAAGFRGWAVSRIMSDEVAAAYDRLMSETEAVRKAGQETVRGWNDPDKIGAVMDALVERLGVERDMTAPLESLVELLPSSPERARAVADAVRACRAKLEPGHVVVLSESDLDPLKSLLRDMQEDATVPAITRNAIREQGH